MRIRFEASINSVKDPEPDLVGSVFFLADPDPDRHPGPADPNLDPRPD